MNRTYGIFTGSSRGQRTRRTPRAYLRGSVLREGSNTLTAEPTTEVTRCALRQEPAGLASCKIGRHRLPSLLVRGQVDNRELFTLTTSTVKLDMPLMFRAREKLEQQRGRRRASSEKTTVAYTTHQRQPHFHVQTSPQVLALALAFTLLPWPLFTYLQSGRNRDVAMPPAL